MSKGKTYWAGFVGNKIHEERIPDSYCEATCPSLFKYRSEARMRYQDVRKVRIVEVRKAKK